MLAAAVGVLALGLLTGCDDPAIPTPGGGDQRVEVPQARFSLELPDDWSPEETTVDENLVARGPEDRESIAAFAYPTADRAERQANEMAAALADAAGVTCLRKSDTGLGPDFPVTDCQRAIGARTLRTIFVPVREQPEAPAPSPSDSMAGDADNGDAEGEGGDDGSGTSGDVDSPSPTPEPPAPAPTAQTGRSVLVVFRLYGLQLAKVEPTVESVVDSVEFDED